MGVPDAAARTNEGYHCVFPNERGALCKKDTEGGAKVYHVSCGGYHCVFPNEESNLVLSTAGVTTVDDTVSGRPHLTFITDAT